MTQPDERAADPAIVSEQPPYDERPSGLFQVAAAVGIVAGTLFVVAVVFFAGFFLGGSSDGYGDGRPGPMGAGGRMGTCPMMGGGMVHPMMPGGMMGPAPATVPNHPRP